MYPLCWDNCISCLTRTWRLTKSTSWTALELLIVTNLIWTKVKRHVCYASSDCYLQGRRVGKASGLGEEDLVDCVGKERLGKACSRFRKGILRLRRFVKFVWDPLPFLNSLSQYRISEKDQDAKGVGVLDDVSSRKLAVTPLDTQAINMETLRMPTSRFTASAGHHNYGSIGESSKVVVEYKSYEVNKVNLIRDVASDRINRLIALLHEVEDAHFKILRCVNYFDDTSQRNIGTVFELPPQLNGPPNTPFGVCPVYQAHRLH